MRSVFILGLTSFVVVVISFYIDVVFHLSKIYNLTRGPRNLELINMNNINVNILFGSGESSHRMPF